MRFLEDLLNSFFSTLPNIISALLLLILALVIAAIAKRIVVKLLEKVRADKYIDKLGITDEATGSSLVFIGKLVFLIVFLLFLPGVLDKLGMQSVSAPITNLISQFLNYIPNIVAAIVILVVGFFIAKLVKQILTPLLKKLNVDKIQKKAGISSTENTAISTAIAYIVYVLILIPVFIAALQALNISAISVPAIAMLDNIVSFLPNIFAAIVIMIIGAFIAKIVGNLVKEILSGIGTDSILKKVVPEDNVKLKELSLSKVIGNIVKYILILLFVVEAINILKLNVLQFVGEAIIAYLPLAISAIIILGVALLTATWLESMLLKKFSNSKMIAFVIKAIVITLAVFLTLNQLGIAPSIVNAAFIITLGALAVAFAISFGIGGRDFASSVLKKVEDKNTQHDLGDIQADDTQADDTQASDAQTKE